LCISATTSVSEMSFSTSGNIAIPTLNNFCGTACPCEKKTSSYRISIAHLSEVDFYQILSLQITFGCQCASRNSGILCILYTVQDIMSKYCNISSYRDIYIDIQIRSAHPYVKLLHRYCPPSC